MQFILDPDVCRLGVVCGQHTLNLSVLVLGLSFCRCAWRVTQCRSPKGDVNFLILHYSDKAGELESESWKSLRD